MQNSGAELRGIDGPFLKFHLLLQVLVYTIHATGINKLLSEQGL